MSTPAKRGDIAVIPITFRALYIGSAGTTTTEYHVTIVTSVTRDGNVKAVRTVDSDTVIPLNRFYSGGRRGQIMIAAKNKCDVAGVIESVKLHTWPGHPNQIKAYTSWDEVRDMVLSHKI
jgi:hypothetical protein